MSTETVLAKNATHGSEPSGEGNFSGFYYALRDKQTEIGCSDLIVYVAYGLYKSEKQKEIERLRLQCGRSPTREELSHFVAIAISHIEHYINTATQEQTTFTQFVLDSLQIDVERQIIEASKKIEPIPWWKSAWFGCIGNFFWLFLTAALGLMGLFGNSLQQILKNLLVGGQ